MKTLTLPKLKLKASKKFTGSYANIAYVEFSK